MACVAAKETLRVRPLVTPSSLQREPELKHLSASAFINLQEYHLRCVAAAVELASEYDLWIALDIEEMDHFTEQCDLDDEGARCELRLSPLGGKFLAWWIRYMERSANRLSESPAGSTVLDPFLLSEIHSEISNGTCSNCQDVGHEKLVSFAQYLAKKIDDAISQVTISSIFSFYSRNLTCLCRFLFPWNIEVSACSLT